MTTTTDPAAIRAALAAMRGRAEAATRGEWVAMYGNVLLPDDAGTLAFPVHGDEAEIDPENAAFIAHARQDVPALLSVAEAAAGLLDYQREGGPDFPDWDARFDALARALAALAAGGEAGEVGE